MTPNKTDRPTYYVTLSPAQIRIAKGHILNNDDLAAVGLISKSIKGVNLETKQERSLLISQSQKIIETMKTELLTTNKQIILNLIIVLTIFGAIWAGC